ncbi:hypothetical protein EN766_20365 [Mesorhizobium sp. M2A.F.Ca.ET.046.02.1.1]|nr:hypothetical protein EN766_20365 [Mesorhizobium sp. M2A.F.Ca.ET.046.02.1.1]
MNQLTKVILYTDENGRSRFREEKLGLSEGTPQIQTTALAPCKASQFRYSPVGFYFDFHCSDRPLWVVVLQGEMEISLQDGSSRAFKPGDCFFAENLLPEGAEFDSAIHGHTSRQVGPDPLVTLFVDV